MPGGNSVGQISLDLGLNSSRFNRQVKDLEQKTKKQFTGLTSFLSNFLANVATNLLNKLLSEMGNFVKSSINLASDLQEVENVVDTVFKNMQKEVDAFAQSAMESFGLSELVAKQYMGQLGAMAKAFGYTEKQSYDLARSITGLAGDVASFYNMTTDEAFTKLKAIFTGETESLKSLGIVMTQSALDAFALANGFDKTTNEMSEAEKVALRYKFVLNQLESAQGDFVRTSDGWANQTRVLALQFDTLKSILGEGFIVALTPVVQMLNRVIVKIQDVARAFTNLIKHVMGISTETENMGGGLGDASSSAGDLAENLEGVEKSAEAAKKSILGFDEINKLTPESSSGSALGDIGEFDWGEIGDEISGLEGKADALSSKLIKAYDEITSKITGLYQAFLSNAKPLFKYVQDTLKPLQEEIVRTAENVYKVSTESMSKWLTNHYGTFSKNIKNMVGSAQASFESIVSLATSSLGIFNEALENSFEDVTTGISDFIGGITTLASSVGYVVWDIFATFLKEEKEWVEENKGYLEQTLSDLMSFAGGFASLIGQILSDTGITLVSWWESDGRGMLESLMGALGELKKLLLDIWNKVLLPIFESLAEEIESLWNTSLQPLWANLLEFFSSTMTLISTLLEEYLFPFVSFLVDAFAPRIVGAFESVFKKVGATFNFIITLISNLLSALSGVLKFLTGVFTADWEKAWGGITQVFKAFIKSWIFVVETVANSIVKRLNGMIQSAVEGFQNFVNTIISAINKIADPLGLPLISLVNFNVPQIPELKIPIPELAEGGFIGRNQPTLAVVGDNRNEGEIVAPESKIAEAVARGVAQAISMLNGAFQNENSQPLEVVVQIGDETIVDRVIRGINQENRRAGRVIITA